MENTIAETAPPSKPMMGKIEMRAHEIASLFCGNGLSHNQQTELAMRALANWRFEDLSEGLKDAQQMIDRAFEKISK